jgi:rare lipoprotein A
VPLDRNVWEHRARVGMLWLMKVTVNANQPASSAPNWHAFVPLAALVIVLFSSGCATKLVGKPDASALSAGKAYNRPYTVKGKRYYPMASAKGYAEYGIASWYGWESGNRTAMGEAFDPRRLTAAHRTLPLPTRVHVTNLENQRSVVVVVNDRGPFIDNRLIDLSDGAARKIGLRRSGTARVKVVAIDADVSAR